MEEVIEKPIGDELLFVSKDEQGRIGSLYFANGRIRLVHCAGPWIVLDDVPPLRVTICESEKVDILAGIENIKSGGGAYTEIEAYLLDKRYAGQEPKRLIELFQNSTIHPSRGAIDDSCISVFQPHVEAIKACVRGLMNELAYSVARGKVDNYLLKRSKYYCDKDNYEAYNDMCESFRIIKRGDRDIISEANSKLFKLIVTTNPEIRIYNPQECPIPEK